MSDTPNQQTPEPSLSDRVRSLRLGDKGNERGQRSPLAIVPWLLATVLLLTSLAFGYRAYRVSGTYRDIDAGKEVGEAKKKPNTYTPTDPGDSAADTAAPGEVVLQSKGYVVPVSLIQVSPKVGGQLERIADGFKEGAKFNKGDVLAWIEVRDYKAELDQSQAVYDSARERYDEIKKTMPLEVKQAEADLEESKQVATQQKLERDRSKRLAASNSVAQREYEQAQYAYTGTTARIKKLEATLELIRVGRMDTRIRAAEFEVKQAAAALDKAKFRFENTEIKAPVTGIILSKKAEIGNTVNPLAFSSTGSSASFCEMADLRELEIDLSIQERDIARVEEGMPCQVMPDAYQSDKGFLKRHPRGYEGFVSRLMPMADRAKGAISVRVKIKFIPEDEAGKYLRPEMSALVSFMKK